MVDATKPESTFVSRAKSGLIYSSSDEDIRANNITRAEAIETAVKLAEKVDDQIAQYATQKKPKPVIVKAMYEGKPVVGMPWDALNIIGTLKVRSETQAYSDYDFLPLGVETGKYRDARGMLHFIDPKPYGLTIQDGLVVSIEHP